MDSYSDVFVKMCVFFFIIILVCAWNRSSLQMWCFCCSVDFICISVCWLKVWDATTFMRVVLSSDLSAFGFKLSLGSTKEMAFRGGCCGRHALSLLVVSIPNMNLGKASLSTLSLHLYVQLFQILWQLCFLSNQLVRRLAHFIGSCLPLCLSCLFAMQT